MNKFFTNLIKLPSLFTAALISLYQVLLSPDHSWLSASFPHGFCRHYPTCSEYSRQSFLKFGFLKGFYLSSKRLAHCHPWAEPSVDPVPGQFGI